jgi:hypothetical protein
MDVRNYIRNLLKETFGPSVVMYSAVVIEDPAEVQKIKELASQYVPQTGWRIPVHYHMTISQGPLPESLRLRGDLNKEVELTINMIGQSQNAIAFGTFGYYSQNEMPHITIGFNKKYGAAPADSKKIENWQPIDKIKVVGIIREIGSSNKVLKGPNELDEMMGYTASDVSGSIYAFPGIPREFPDPEDYDQFGNLKTDVAR